jgi:NitT/TauT family transport system ATP-binding protein
VSLSGFEDAYPHELSGGMKSRAAIAHALALDPAILLMDEAFGALDELTRLALNFELLRIWEKQRSTVVFVTHNVAEAVLLADRVVVLSRRPGRIVEDLEVTLPRPRDKSVLGSTEFFELSNRARHALYSSASYS